MFTDHFHVFSGGPVRFPIEFYKPFKTINKSLFPIKQRYRKTAVATFLGFSSEKRCNLLSSWPPKTSLSVDSFTFFYPRIEYKYLFIPISFPGFGTAREIAATNEQFIQLPNCHVSPYGLIKILMIV